MHVGLVISIFASIAFAAPSYPGVNYWFSLWVSLHVTLWIPHPIYTSQWRFVHKDGF